MEGINAEILKAIKGELLSALGYTDPGAVAMQLLPRCWMIRLPPFVCRSRSEFIKTALLNLCRVSGKEVLLAAAALGATIADPIKGLAIFDGISWEQLIVMNEILKNTSVPCSPRERRAHLSMWTSPLEAETGTAYAR